MGNGAEDHGLRHKCREERHGRDRDGPDEAENRGPRHRAVKAAQFARLGRARAIEHCAHRHEQESLEHDVGKGVGDRAVQGKRRTDPDGADHEADLVVRGIG